MLLKENNEQQSGVTQHSAMQSYRYHTEYPKRVLFLLRHNSFPTLTTLICYRMTHHRFFFFNLLYYYSVLFQQIKSKERTLRVQRKSFVL